MSQSRAKVLSLRPTFFVKRSLDSVQESVTDSSMDTAYLTACCGPPASESRRVLRNYSYLGCCLPASLFCSCLDGRIDGWIDRSLFTFLDGWISDVTRTSPSRPHGTSEIWAWSARTCAYATPRSARPWVCTREAHILVLAG